MGRGRASGRRPEPMCGDVLRRGEWDWFRGTGPAFRATQATLRTRRTLFRNGALNKTRTARTMALDRRQIGCSDQTSETWEARTMEECPRREENLSHCTCPSEDCERKGQCCECVAAHREGGSLPSCLKAIAAQKA